MRFAKLQGAGNDFVLVEESEVRENWGALARRLCRRHFDVGADGLLILGPSKVADFAMSIVNPDGSEAQACGNGLRCMARYILDKGYISSITDRVKIETKSGIREVILCRNNDRVECFSTNMGHPCFEAAEIPVRVDNATYVGPMVSGYRLDVGREHLLLNFVGMGNPHAIYFMDGPVQDFPLERIGSEVEKHPIFPQQVNFEVAHVLSRDQIEVRVWERGVGETLACGTGACAVAVSAQILGFVDHDVDIILPGGVLTVQWDGIGEVYLNGPAEVVFWGVK